MSERLSNVDFQDLRLDEPVFRRSHALICRRAASIERTYQEMKGYDFHTRFGHGSAHQFDLIEFSQMKSPHYSVVE
jgi:hypothetical protein